MTINGNIFDKAGIATYQRLLRVASAAQKATASNIANATTPGYSAKGVNFREEMSRAIEGASKAVTTDPRHLSGRPSRIIKIKDIGEGAQSSGVNDVDIEREMADLAENQMMYEFGAKRLSRTFATLRMAIRGKAQ